MRRKEEVIEEEDVLDQTTDRMLTVLRLLIFIIVPIILFYLMEAFEHNAFEEVRSLAQLYNILLFELIAWLLFFVTGSGRTALRIETGIALVYGLVNHYVMAFRSTPFVPWDIFSIKTAASVAGNYDFTPTKELIMVCIGFVILFVLLHFVKLNFEYGLWLRIIPVLCVSIVLGLFTNLLWDDDFQTDSYLYPFLFTPSHMTKVNGMAVTFAMDMEYMFVEKPEGYSKNRAEAILEDYATDSEKIAKEDCPNIIVVMNEAFSDLSVLGDFTASEDYMPYIHSLQQGNKNTITGNLMVSVCGGNTANTEFEFLTGHTMDYFPVGSIPYQQYISGKVPSLASQLAQMGYKTYGMHPYNASGWNRDKVYPWLGFEQSYFLPDFTGRYYIRNYVSDKTAYQKIIDTFEEKKAGQPVFIFEVTMQNHGSYSDLHKNFTPDVNVEEFESTSLEQYLSLLKVSDQEFERLIEYFSYVPEKTMIVFFGDHQPNDYTVRPIQVLNSVDASDMSVEEAQRRYQVPYVIWANYDINEGTGVDTDISFLGAQALKEAGVPLTAYQNFLLELEKNPDSEKLLEQYEVLQYYFMFEDQGN